MTVRSVLSGVSFTDLISARQKDTSCVLVAGYRMNRYPVAGPLATKFRFFCVVERRRITGHVKGNRRKVVVPQEDAYVCPRRDA